MKMKLQKKKKNHIVCASGCNRVIRLAKKKKKVCDVLHNFGLVPKLIRQIQLYEYSEVKSFFIHAVLNNTHLLQIFFFFVNFWVT